MRKKAVKVFIYMRNSEDYKLWNILLMQDSQSKTDAFFKYLQKRPVSKWSRSTMKVISRHLLTRSIETFDRRVGQTIELFGEMNLDNMRNLIEKMRGYQQSLFPYRKHDDIGRIIFGEHDRVRIFTDRMEEVHGRFRPIRSAA